MCGKKSIKKHNSSSKSVKLALMFNSTSSLSLYLDELLVLVTTYTGLHRRLLCFSFESACVRVAVLPHCSQLNHDASSSDCNCPCLHLRSTSPKPQRAAPSLAGGQSPHS